MPSVNHFIRNLDSQIWHGMENIASNHPNASRLLALPISIGTFIRDTLTTPAKCIEEVVLTIKSVKAYRAEQNPKMLFWRRNDIEWHSFHAVKYMIMTPFSPLVGIVDAIISLVKVGISPFKTAKINAAKQDFSSFIEESHYIEMKSYSNGKLVDFADKVEFAKATLNRFKKQVLMAPNHEEVKNLHFLDNEVFKRQIIDEVALKYLKFREARNVYTDTYMQVHQTHRENERALKNQIIKLNKAWKEFQHLLIQTSYTEASTMVFAPNLE